MNTNVRDESTEYMEETELADVGQTVKAFEIALNFQL